MLKDIKEWDKIVYDRYAKKEFILVEKIEEIKSTKTINWKEVETGEKIEMINWKYSIRWPLRLPTPLELEVWNFI